MASKRRLRRKCSGKVAYPDAPAALDALAEHRAKGVYSLHAYACPFGAHWHLGHRPASISRAIAARTGTR